MARINDPKITAQIAELAARDSVDTTEIIATLNQALPPGQQLKQSTDITTGMYKEFSDFDKIDAKVEMVTSGMWSGDNDSTITDFTRIASGSESADFYVDVYNEDPENDAAEPQFAISYGHINGGGSTLIEENPNAKEASKVTYLQYRSMLLTAGQEKFIIDDDEVDHFYVININRNRYRERVDPGNWTIKIDTAEYIDDSGKELGAEYGSIKSVYNIVEKNVDDPKNVVGLFYPNHGVMIFNTSVTTSGSPEETTGTEQQNFDILRNAIDEFTARRLENISTQHFFVRATNREFNYSNNPSFTKDDSERFRHRSFETDPKTYITTVGLYNNSNEMVAVAKTSQPIEKSFSKETLIKVRLAF